MKIFLDIPTLPLKAFHKVGGSIKLYDPIDAGIAIVALSESGAAAGAGAAVADAVGSAALIDGAAMGAGDFIAADALASQGSEALFSAANSLGVPVDQALTEGLLNADGTLTDAGAAQLMTGDPTNVYTPLEKATMGLPSGSDLLKGAQTAAGALGAASKILSPAKTSAGTSSGSGGGGGSAYYQSPTASGLSTGSPAASTTSGLLNFAPLALENTPIAPVFAASNPATVKLARGGALHREIPNHPALENIDPQLLNILIRKIKPFRDGDKTHIPEFITGATGHYVKGRGDGQSDDIPAMLANGEYVFDAETVAQLGNGSSDAGAKALDEMRENIRKQKRSAPVNKIPPKAKSPLEYLKG
jgi:hypothetical protein